MDSTATKLSTIIVSAGNLKLMLPSSMIAEVVSCRNTKLLPPSPAAPAWQVGAFQWRGWTVPLINYGNACGQSPSMAAVDLANTRSIVLKKTDVGMGQPFIAFLIESTPKVVTATAEGVRDTGPVNGEVSPFVARYVGYENEQLVIPSFIAIERALNAYVAKTKAQAES